MTIISRLIAILRQVSIEPLVLLFYTGFAIFNTTSFSMLYHKICVQKLGYDASDDDCGNIDDELQEDATAWIQYDVVAITIPSSFVCLYLSAWGDRNGRKANFLIAMAGVIVYMLAFIVATQYESSPLWILPVVSVGAGCTGFVMLFVAASYQYMADTARDEHTLTVRMTLMVCSWSLGYCEMAVLAPKILHQTIINSSFHVSHPKSSVSIQYQI